MSENSYPVELISTARRNSNEIREEVEAKSSGSQSREKPNAVKNRAASLVFESQGDLNNDPIERNFKDKHKQFESLATYPSDTAIYKEWLKEHLAFISDWENWFVVTIIAILMGLIGFIIKVATDNLFIFQYSSMKRFLESGEGLKLWFYYTSFGVFCSVMSSLIVVYLCSESPTGNGLPEIMAFLNGVAVHKVLSGKKLIWKMISSTFANLSTLPLGIEGPMIEIGSMIPTVLARIRSPPGLVRKDASALKKVFLHPYLRLRLALFRKRDGHERQILACIGAATGLASALNAPIASLCFSIEAMSSRWSNTSSWQTFYGCVIASSTTELLVLLLAYFISEGKFVLHVTEFPIFDIYEKVIVTVSLLVPAVFVGVLGGLFGALFVFLTVRLVEVKKFLYDKLNKQTADGAKIIDTFLTMILFTSTVIITLSINSCHPVYHYERPKYAYSRHFNLISYSCQNKLHFHTNTTNRLSPSVTLLGDYHEGASLLCIHWDQLIMNLLSRNTNDLFSISLLSWIFLIYFIFSSLAGSGTVSGGLLIPQIILGALYGRIIGQTFFKLMTILSPSEEPKWDWIDPGVVALMGAASFISGASRLPITSIVLMIEMTKDLSFIFLIMISAFIAKFVGDRLIQSLEICLMEINAIPFLNPELRVYWAGKRINLEIFEAGDIMAGPVQTLHATESLRNVASVLINTQHGGFPVLLDQDDDSSTLVGIATRTELVILLCSLHLLDVDLEKYNLRRVDIDRLHNMYTQYSNDPNVIKNYETLNTLLNVYLMDVQYQESLIDLLPIVDMSTVRVPVSFSLERTYSLFRESGLRHLVVVGGTDEVIGIITRKDLIRSVVEHRIHKRIRQANAAQNRLADASKNNYLAEYDPNTTKQRQERR